MKNKFKSFTLITFGLVFGVLISVNLSVFADKKSEAKKLPVEDLRILLRYLARLKLTM